MTCDALRLELGAYVLGGLTDAQRARIDAHLLGCPACAAELSELEDAADALTRVSRQDLGQASRTPSSDLFHRVHTAIEDDRARQGHRRHRLQLVAAASVLLIGAGAGAGIAISGHRDGVSTQASADGVQMSVRVANQPGGTALTVAVQGLPENEVCHLVAVSRTGERQDAGTWTASYDGAARVLETSTFPASQLSDLELDGTDGKPLVTVPTK